MFIRITDMKVGDTITDADLVLIEATLRTTRTNKPFLSVKFSDGIYEIAGNCWDWSKPVPEVGEVYAVCATVGEYLGTKQLTPTALKPSTASVVSFAKHYIEEWDGEALWFECRRYIDTIRHPVLHDITDIVYGVYSQELKNATSAKSIHHCGVYGNIAHSLEVTKLTDAICTNWNCTGSKVPVSRDLAVAGALLHDIGKAFVYSIDGPCITTNEDGVLFDHIALGVQKLQAIQWPRKYESCIKLLTHIILSHHGELEKGSPVTPHFIEAVIVNYADGISATLNTLSTANEKAEAEGKCVTDKLWTMGNSVQVLQKRVAELLEEQTEAIKM